MDKELRNTLERCVKVDGTKGLSFEEVCKYGHKAFLNIERNGEYIGRFYFNMTGYNSDFTLYNLDGVARTFGEKGKTTVIREFKEAVNGGFRYIDNYK